TAAQQRQALLAPEVDRERLHGAVVDAELPVRIAAGGEEQQRPAPRLAQVGVGEVDLDAREIGDDRLGVAELFALELSEDVRHRIHSRIIACAPRTSRSPSSMPPTTSETVWSPATTSAAGTSTSQPATAARTRGNTYATNAASTTARAVWPLG